MNALFANLMNDEAGFIVSAELVMIATLGVLAMAVDSRKSPGTSTTNCKTLVVRSVP